MKIFQLKTRPCSVNLEVLAHSRQVVEGLYPDLLQVVLVTFGEEKNQFQNLRGK